MGWGILRRLSPIGTKFHLVPAQDWVDSTFLPFTVRFALSHLLKHTAERVMAFGVSVKVSIAVPGKACAAGQAGRLAKARNTA
jgi:hypothetical protein